MSQLDPQLKRLFKWARARLPSGPESPPFGFATRVLAGRGAPGLPTLLEELQQTAWSLTCIALATIACGCIVLLTQRSASVPEADLPSAVSYVANNLPL